MKKNQIVNKKQMTKRDTETILKNQTNILSRKVMKQMLGGMKAAKLGSNVLPIPTPDYPDIH